MPEKEETALDAARSRFIGGLGRKSAELRGALSLVMADPSGDRGRDELRRRMHALHASAQVFRVEELSDLVSGAIAILDQIRRDGRSIDDAELDSLLAVTASVADLCVPDASEHAHGGGDSVAAPARSVFPSPTTGGTRPGLQATNGARHDYDLAPTRPGTHPSVAAHSSGTSVDANAATRARVADLALDPGGKMRLRVDTVISVMLVGARATRLAAALAPNVFDIVATLPQDTLRVARASAPDLILVGDDVVQGAESEFVHGLRSDPTTDLVPLVLVTTDAHLGRADAVALGCDDAVAIGDEPRVLGEKLARLAGLMPSSREAELGTRTLREVADRLADEIRHGLVDSVDRGANELLALGDGTELFAAVWSAIARIRTAVVDRSGGRVHFRDTERRGGPSLLAVGEAASAARGAPIGIDVSLEGRRILVADDDPAVRWFFLGLLGDAGADVLEAPDGLTALELARRHSPDLVITDILMPKLDGLALSRELNRDPVLADVPIIFLSWKEDFLHRIRELRRGEFGYLRKEEGASAILDRVRDAFRPRHRFETRLDGPGDVRGRVEGIGVLSLIRSVGRRRREARLTVRDVHNLFEIDIRRGHIVELVRTGSDGAFARGPKALASLLGVSAGRFAVLAPVIGQRAGIEPISAEMIEGAAARLGALVDAVSGKGLALADHVEIDPLVARSILAVSPPEIVDVVRKLEANASPRRWLLSGDVAPEVLTGALVELARRGAVVSVLGEHQEDRVSEALARRRGGVDSSERDGGAPHASRRPLTERVPEEVLIYVDDDDELPEAPAEPEPETVGDAEVSPVADSIPPPRREAPIEVVSDDVTAVTDDDVTGAVDDEDPEFEFPEEDPGSIVIHEPLDIEPVMLTRRPRRREGGFDDTLKVRVEQPPDAPSPSRSTLALGGATALVLGALTTFVYLAARGPTRSAAEPTQSRWSNAQSVGAAPMVPAALLRSLEPPSDDPSLYGENFTVEPGTPAPPVRHGRLRVLGAAGAAVLIDGVNQGAPPVTVLVSEGWHTVIHRAGSDEHVRFVPVRAGMARSIRMQ